MAKLSHKPLSEEKSRAVLDFITFWVENTNPNPADLFSLNFIDNINDEYIEVEKGTHSYESITIDEVISKIYLFACTLNDDDFKSYFIETSNEIISINIEPMSTNQIFTAHLSNLLRHRNFDPTAKRIYRYLDDHNRPLGNSTSLRELYLKGLIPEKEGELPPLLEGTPATAIAIQTRKVSEWI